MKRYISMQRSFRGWRYPVSIMLAACLSLVPATPAAALDLNPSTYFTYNYTFTLSQTTVYLNQVFTMTV